MTAWAGLTVYKYLYTEDNLHKLILYIHHIYFCNGHGIYNLLNICKNKSTAHGCWMLDFFISDIKLQAIYKVIHTSNYDANMFARLVNIISVSHKNIFWCGVGWGGYNLFL